MRLLQGSVIIDVVARVQHITISGYTDGALRSTFTDSISEPIGRVQRSRLVTIVCRLQVGGQDRARAVTFSSHQAGDSNYCGELGASRSSSLPHFLLTSRRIAMLV